MTAATLTATRGARVPVGGHVVAYCRISSDRNGAGLGVAAQEAAIRETAAAMGLRIDVVLTDNDVSAHNRRKVRPGYAELLELLAEGSVSKILVWHTDRLHRQMRELVTFVDLLADTGATVHSVTAGPLDLASPAGVLSAHVAGAIAQHESAHKAERLRLMHERKAEAGQFHGGRRRFGYDEKMTALDEAEAEALRDAAARVLAGESLLSITRDWNARGIATPSGKPWRASNLGKLLQGRHLAGLRVHGDTTTAAEWPAVFDAATHEAVTRFLSNPDRRVSGFTGTRLYVLTGLLRCGVCDGPLYGRPTKLKSGAAYVCKAGSHTQAPVRDVNPTVRDLVVGRLSAIDASGVFVVPADAVRANARAAERSALTANRRDTVKAVRLSPDDKADALAAIDDALAALDAEAVADDDAARMPLRVLDGLTGHPADVTAELFDGLTFDRQRAVIGALGAPVLARAARKGVGLAWDSERVTVRWSEIG